jgi:hypothetical protein
MHRSEQYRKVSWRNLIKFVVENFHEIFNRVAHSARVNVYGIPFIREMPKITGVSGSDLVIKCPVAGYPIDKIHWERGKFSMKH